jgi:hypothetical protein
MHSYKGPGIRRGTNNAQRGKTKEKKMAYQQTLIDVLGLWLLTDTTGLKVHLAGKAKKVRLSTVVPGWNRDLNQKGTSVEESSKAGAITIADESDLDYLIEVLNTDVREAIAEHLVVPEPEEEEEPEEEVPATVVRRRGGVTGKAKATAKAKGRGKGKTKAAAKLSDEEELAELANSFKLSSRKACEKFLTNPAVALYSPKAHAFALAGGGNFERLKKYAAQVKAMVLEDVDLTECGEPCNF